MSVIPCRSLDEAIDIGNSVEYGLSASIYTQDINRAFSAMRDLYTGIFYVNAPTIGAEVHLPFGGTKNTGNGHREAGVAALDVFSEWKSIYIDFSGKLQRAQIRSRWRYSKVLRGSPRFSPGSARLYGVLAGSVRGSPGFTGFLGHRAARPYLSRTVEPAEPCGNLAEPGERLANRSNLAEP